MRKETVPIDMASEQKEILGIISKRQLIYMAIGGAIIYAYIPIVFSLFSNIVLAIIFSFISAIPTILLVGILGFYKKNKRYMYFDRYLLIKLGYKNQIGIWRKGKREKDWMVDKD